MSDIIVCCGYGERSPPLARSTNRLGWLVVTLNGSMLAKVCPSLERTAAIHIMNEQASGRSLCESWQAVRERVCVCVGMREWSAIEA